MPSQLELLLMRDERGAEMVKRKRERESATAKPSNALELGPLRQQLRELSGVEPWTLSS